MSIIVNRIGMTLVMLTAGLLLSCQGITSANSEIDWLEGEWAWVRSCGGCIYQCVYPEYTAQITVSFVDGQFEKRSGERLIDTGTYCHSSTDEDGTAYYDLTFEGKYTSQSVYVSSDGTLVIVGGWGVLTQYYELY